MEVFYKIVALLGGLAMFLFGMRMMGDSLKKSSGGAMKAALAKATSRPAIGFIFGTLVTCMIQSSTATIVLTVGLVGAGFLTFRQSVGIVLGANVGTAITAQIIRLMDVSAGSVSLLYFFKADNLAPLALTIGIICIMFLKSEKANNLGSILVGFGILFMGLIFMGQSVSAMGDSLSGLLTMFEDNYLLGFLVGVLVTGIIQSSSAVVGILQTMASSVGVRFCGVFAVILGVNIGDCLTTFLVSRIGAKPDQVRTATVHVIYNVIAATLLALGLLIGRMTGLITDALWNLELNSGGVANVHGIFRLIPAVLLLPFANKLADLAERIVPDKPVESEDAAIEGSLRELDSRLVTSATLALDQSQHLIRHMADIALQNYDAALSQLFDYEPKLRERIDQREDLLDRMADATNRYLVEVNTHIVLERDRQLQSVQIKALTSFERSGDHAMNIEKDVEHLVSHGGKFSTEALDEIAVAGDAVREVLRRTVEAYKTGDQELARSVEPIEEVVDSLVDTLTGRHIQRMTDGRCDVYSGIQFENMLSSLERISDQCSSLAVHILGLHDSHIRGQEHQYVHNLHHSNDAYFWKTYNENYEKYYGRLNSLKNTANETTAETTEE